MADSSVSSSSRQTRTARKPAQPSRGSKALTTVIEQSVEARLVAAAPRMADIPATLEGVDVCWTFARDLLAAGMEAPEGDGDVRVRPYGYDRTVLEFHAPEGTAVIHVRSGELRRFLEATSELVPTGLEHLHLDLDHDLAELMRDA